MTFSFTLTSESLAQPPWKEQMKRQREFERENAKRFREINREQQKRVRDIFRERGEAEAEFERERFKSFAQQQREAAKWQAEQQREQFKDWEEQQRFFAEQQRERFQNQREFQRDRGRFGGDFFQGQPLAGNGFDRGFGFQQPAPGFFQSFPAIPQGQRFAKPSLGLQNEIGQHFQYGHPGIGQSPVQVPGGIIVNSPGNQTFQQGSVIHHGPVLNGPGEPVLHGNYGTSVLQPEAIPPFQTQGLVAPPISDGPIQ